MREVSSHLYMCTCWFNTYNYRFCCVIENTGIWLADARNTLTFMFALCNETRIHSIGASDCSGVEQEKTNAITKDKNILLFDPAVWTTYVTHFVTWTDLLVQWFKIVCRSTDMCTNADKSMYSKSVWMPGDFLMKHSLYGKIQWIFLLQ